MASYRRYKKRTFKRKPKSWYNRRYSVSASPLQVAQTALKGVNYIRGLVNSEMYKLDGATSFGVPNTGVIQHLSGIAQGDGDNARTGNSVLAKRNNMRFVFTQNVAALDTLYRVIFFVDTQQVADTTPTIADILDTNSTLSPLNSNTAGRYKILKNYFFHTSNSSDTVKNITCSIPLNMHVRYNGTASTDIQKNGLYVLFLTDQAAVSQPTVFYFNRFYYHDN